MICSLCPRKCGAKRTENENVGGFCQSPLTARVARASLHFWEEPCISGEKGSGTVFFSGCSLGCVFCQNDEISHKNFGKTVTAERLAEIFKELQEQGAENINLVNPTHYVLAIKEAFKIFKPVIPVVYNSGGYESEETLKIADEFTDIYLLDLKYLSNDRALKYSNAENYPSVATNAIKHCYKSKPNVFDERGMLKKGVIIRHLIMPQATNEAISVIKWVEQNTPNAILSLMSQYTPCGNLESYPEINRKLTVREHNKVMDAAEKSSIEIIFTQELASGSEEYIPPFNLEGV